MSLIPQEQSGAVEACWAHNPEVRGSKPRSANFLNYMIKIFGQFFKTKYLFNNKIITKNNDCIGRESNPGHPRGRRVFYH